MIQLSELIAATRLPSRIAANGAVRWIAVAGPTRHIELAVIEETIDHAPHVRLLFPFGDDPVDISAPLLAYYLELAADMTLFRLYLSDADRLCLTATYALEALDAASLAWLVREFARYCDHFYPDLAVPRTN